MRKFKRVLVTGGAGFIGSALVRMLVKDVAIEVINVDALTYAGDLSALESLQTHENKDLHDFHRIDICNVSMLNELFEKTRPDAIIHLAAETHVDRSIDNPFQCVQTNVMGTLNMLEATRTYWHHLSLEKQKNFRFLHVSTDEVYGDIAIDSPAVVEQDAYAPSSPYAASKASADHLVRAWHRTYGLPVLLTHCCNNYGAYQHPEKLIPHMILNALTGHELPIYGDGLQQRQWLFVDDHVRALWCVVQHGNVGETYHIGVQKTQSNLDLVKQLCECLNTYMPAQKIGIKSYTSLITHVEDRPGHDRRYTLATGKIRRELGWFPEVSLAQGLDATVAWYVHNRSWWERILNQGYTLNRQGENKKEWSHHDVLTRQS